MNASTVTSKILKLYSNSNILDGYTNSYAKLKDYFVSLFIKTTNKNHLIRASLESIAYQVKDSIDAMQKDLGIKMNTLKVDGGASQNNFLMQFQSDILDCKVVRPKVVEVTALGASYLAGLQVGYWKDIEDIRRNKVIERVFNPNLQCEKRERRIRGWSNCPHQGADFHWNHRCHQRQASNRHLWCDENIGRPKKT